MPFPLSYVFWYYAGGLYSVITIWFNYIRFAWLVFGIPHLLLTLFAPWKHDVAPKTWLGFDPAKAAQRLIWNLIARVLGSIVRAGTIFFGFAALLIVLIVGAAFTTVWVAAPIAIVASLVGTIAETTRVVALVALGASVFVVAVSLFGFIHRMPQVFRPTDRRDLFRKSFRDRVFARLGVGPDRRGVDDWVPDDAFEARLHELNLTAEDFAEIVGFEADAAERREIRSRTWLWQNLRKTVPVSRGWEFGYTPHLDRYSRDLSKFDFSDYRKLHLFGRDDELKVVSLVLARPTENNVVIVGDTGIGKKTFVHALVRKIREGDIPGFERFRFLRFDIGMAVGDAANRGEDVENYIRYLFAEATNAGNVILIIDDLGSYLGTGRDSGHRNLGPVFSEYLAMPNFRMIGLSGTAAYHAIVAANDGVTRYFEAVYLHELDEKGVIEALLNVIEPQERGRVLFTWKALRKVYELAGEINWDVAYPEKAIDLAQQAILYAQSSGVSGPITPDDVEKFVSMKTGMPMGELGKEEKDRLLRLEDVLHERVVGQHQAVRQVAEALRRARAGLSDPKRPLGSFLFLGPTGVGKTETAKALAEAYFGDEERMIRIDMSEFQGTDAAERLIGSSATGEKGQLTEAIRNRPYSVLLLDEIEKAYTRALDIFLQIVDEGFVTDGFGKKISFRKTIIIATSNAGSALIVDLMERNVAVDEAKREVIKEIVRQNIFRMEFMNRFDDIIFFSSLEPGELVRVVIFKLEKLAARVKKEKNITLSFSPDVASAVVERGYEPSFGARSINRYIEDNIEDVIVRKLLSSEISEGGNATITAADLE